MIQFKAITMFRNDIPIIVVSRLTITAATLIVNAFLYILGLDLYFEKIKDLTIRNIWQ